ncbi:transcription elongation factor A N-terminal and central domain-containing protein 2-like [Ptychodera flava]|uniref:transcription elongation factor A N-terminal and central domain-containing protein 2-like n=1 Tax=Ptychodera flava TaxID=63121 RepID=UPI00396A0434
MREPEVSNSCRVQTVRCVLWSFSEMDKYLTRTPRQACQSKSQDTPKTKGFRQATIESLQRVVVVEDILRLKVTLELENQTKENLLQALHELGKKIPSKEVLLSTKIGHTLSSVRKHSDPEVASLARKIRRDWIKFVQEKSNRPVIEVRADAKTERQRSSGRKLLAGALSVPDASTLVENIEREVFYQNKRLLNNTYRRTMRTLIFAARNKEDIRTKIRDGELSVDEFISMHRK